MQRGAAISRHGRERASRSAHTVEGDLVPLPVDAVVIPAVGVVRPTDERPMESPGVGARVAERCGLVAYALRGRHTRARAVVRPTREGLGVPRHALVPDQVGQVAVIIAERIV